MDPLRIDNLGSFINWLKVDSTESTIYRGQPANCSLLPKIARLPDSQAAHDEELKLLADFIRRGATHLLTLPSDNWERLAVAQHHGVHTRLLDWTENPLAALWFAIRAANGDVRREDVEVWAYNPAGECQRDQYHRVHGNCDPLELTEIVVYHPQQVSPRISAQKGCFTVHPWKGEEFLPLRSSGHGMVRSVQIRAAVLSDLWEELGKCGISESTMFPDLDGLARELCQRLVRRQTN
jgi:hypothetical protein